MKTTLKLLLILSAVSAFTGVEIAAQAESVPAPTNLGVVSNSNTQATVAWQSGGGDTESFYVVYAPGSTAPICNTTGRPAWDSTSFQISSLIPNTQYAVGVCAADPEGDVSPDTAITFVTMNNEVDMPANLNLYADSEYSVSVTWTASQYNVSYYVVYQPGAVAPMCNATGRPTGSGTSYEMQSLVPGTQYTVGVCAVDAYGDVSAEAIGSVTTP